ncbi:MAG: hypothetical protein DMF82_10425 [Acidobacteria bacterium]|nr:MAG: hypothetical protein DMF82_10425 [Acidobacteriota bacterium]
MKSPWPLVAAALVASALPLGAAEREKKKRPGRFRVGPVYLTPKLQLKNAGVDTNVFNQRTGEVPDNSVVLSPTMLAAWPVGRRLRLTGESHVDLNYFRRQTNERSTDFGGEGRAEVDIGPFTLFGAGGGGQSRQRFSIDLDQRVLRHERWGSTGFTVTPTRRVSATVLGTGRVYEYANLLVDGVNVKENLDRNELTATAQLRYALTSRTTLVGSADAIEDRFLQQPRAASRLSRSYRYMGGFEFGEKALFRGRLLAGIREFPASPSAPSYQGPALATSLSLPLLHFGVGTVLAERDIYFALTPTTLGTERLRNTYVSTRFGGEAMVNLPLALFARANFNFEEAKYLLPYQLGTMLAPRVDHLWTAGASLLRAFRAGIRIGGTIQWGRRVSSFPDFSYQGLRYGVQAELVP